MTTWLADNPATVVSLVGVAIAGLGLWLTAPDAFRHLWDREVTPRVQSIGSRVRSVLTLLPGVDEPASGEAQTVALGQAVEGEAALSLGTLTTKITGRVGTWDSTGSAHERVERLAAKVTALSKRLDDQIAEERRAASEEVATERKARLEADKKLHEGIREVAHRVNELDEEMQRHQEDTVEIDAYGLPVVFIGIVLTGIPDLIAFGGWASAVPAILFAVALTWWSRRRALVRREPKASTEAAS